MKLLRPLAKRPGLLAALVVLAGALALQPTEWSWPNRIVFAWDGAVLVYLVIAFVQMATAQGGKTLSHRAADLDQGRTVVLLACVLGALVSVGAVAAELISPAEPFARDVGARLAVVGITLALSWTFIHTTFATHYAHDFYMETEGERRGGLLFPGDEKDPGYWDFVHFAFVIGVANQTADVEIASSAVRRLATWHGIIAFLFNTVILALSINATASLFQG
jgi:uncharacterized membrane protein